MTAIFAIILGVGAILIISAIEGTSLVDTLNNVVSGDVTKNAGSNLSVGGTDTLGRPPVEAPTNALITARPAWLNTPVSQGYAQAATGVKNTGIDFATPFHTPITALAGGQVVSTTYSPQIGGQVLVKFVYNNQTLYAAYVHLDQILVTVGQNINPGDNIGLSGGQLSGGAHNAQYPYSTGPHTLFGLFTQPSASFANSIDPTSFIDSLINLGKTTTL